MSAFPQMMDEEPDSLDSLDYDYMFPGGNDIDQEMGFCHSVSVDARSIPELNLNRDQTQKKGSEESDVWSPMNDCSILSGVVSDSDSKPDTDVSFESKYQEQCQKRGIVGHLPNNGECVRVQFGRSVSDGSQNALNLLLSHLFSNSVCTKYQNIAIWDMNNNFKGEAYKNPDLIIDHVMKKKSRIHILVIRYSYAGTIQWFDDAMRKLSQKITARKLDKRIFIVCPEPNAMTMDNDQAHLLRESEDSKNEHDKRAQDDIVCWVLMRCLSEDPFRAKPRIISRDRDLINGNVDNMLEQATSFELKYLNTECEIENAGTIQPKSLRYLIDK